MYFPARRRNPLKAHWPRPFGRAFFFVFLSSVSFFSSFFSPFVFLFYFLSFSLKSTLLNCAPSFLSLSSVLKYRMLRILHYHWVLFYLLVKFYKNKLKRVGRYIVMHKEKVIRYSWYSSSALAALLIISPARFHSVEMWCQKNKLELRGLTQWCTENDARPVIKIKVVKTRRFMFNSLSAALKIAKLKKQWFRNSAKGGFRKGWIGRGTDEESIKLCLLENLTPAFLPIDKSLIKLSYEMRSPWFLFLVIVAYTIRQCANTLWKFRVLWCRDERYLYLMTRLKA